MRLNHKNLALPVVSFYVLTQTKILFTKNEPYHKFIYKIEPYYLLFIQIQESFYKKMLQRMTRNIYIKVLIKKNDLVGNQNWKNRNSRSNENL